MSEIAGTTSAWSYRAGDWFAVFGGRVTIVLPASERDRVVALWALVDGGAGFDEVLDGLLASGLSTLPGFVLVSTDGGPTRVLLRGAGVTARLSASGEEQELDGAAGHTWVERSVEGVTTLSVSLPEAREDAAPESGAVDFPILTGLVRVSRLDRPAAVAPTAPAVAASAAPLEVAGAPEASPLDDEADTAMTVGAAPVDIDPLTGPLPEDVPAQLDDAQPDAQPNVQPDLPDHQPTEQAGPPDGPPSWVPPPPPPPPLAEPPLTVGTWQPLGGSIPPPPLDPPLDPPTMDIDHDGLTIAGSGDQPAPPPPPGIPGQPAAPPVTQPVAKLLVSDGQSMVVDRAVLVGRAPEARRFSSSEQPALLTVPSRLHEISSTHIEIRPGTGADHGAAVVTDMGSTNGTVLVQPGLGPEDLKPGIAVQLIPGAVINLGDGVTIQVTRP